MAQDGLQEDVRELRSWGEAEGTSGSSGAGRKARRGPGILTVAGAAAEAGTWEASQAGCGMWGGGTWADKGMGEA